MEQPVEKLAIVHRAAVVAGTGAVGLGQRFVGIVEKAFRRKAFSKHSDAISIGKVLTATTLNDFRETSAPAGAYGALLACSVAQKPALIEFDSPTFQPELKTPDMWYCSMGSSQPITDPFLALMRDVFWSSGQPNVSDAAFIVTWTLDHAIAVNPGGVNGPARVAVLRLQEGSFVAEMLDDGVLDGHRALIDDAKNRLRELKHVLSDGTDAPDTPRSPP